MTFIFQMIASRQVSKISALIKFVVVGDHRFWTFNLCHHDAQFYIIQLHFTGKLLSCVIFINVTNFVFIALLQEMNQGFTEFAEESSEEPYSRVSVVEKDCYS